MAATHQSQASPVMRHHLPFRMGSARDERPSPPPPTCELYRIILPSSASARRQGAQTPARVHIESGKRLVQNQQLRIMQQSPDSRIFCPCFGIRTTEANADPPYENRRSICPLRAPARAAQSAKLPTSSGTRGPPMRYRCGSSARSPCALKADHRADVSTLKENLPSFGSIKPGDTQSCSCPLRLATYPDFAGRIRADIGHRGYPVVLF